MIKVAIIDDKNGTRLPLQDYLNRDKSHFRKIHPYNSIDTFLSDTYKHIDLDIIILDMCLSIGLTSVEGLAIIHECKHLKKAKVLMLTSLSQNNYAIFKLLCSCASSYIDKEMPLYNIKEAVLCLYQKGALVRKSLPALPPPKINIPSSNSNHNGTLLTFREKQIIQGIIDRESEFNICQELEIEPYLLRRYIRSARR